MGSEYWLCFVKTEEGMEHKIEVGTEPVGRESVRSDRKQKYRSIRVTTRAGSSQTKLVFRTRMDPREGPCSSVFHPSDLLPVSPSGPCHRAPAGGR